MFNNVGELADHVMLPVEDQRKREAEFLLKDGQGEMICDLKKKRDIERKNNDYGNSGNCT